MSQAELLLGLGMAMSGGTDAMCDGLSKIGQAGFCNEDTLPSRENGQHSQEALEAAGVQFLGAVDGDPMFQRVKFPEGWTKRATSHYLYTDLIDDRGRNRAQIMYSSVPWDRDAHYYAFCRYSIETEYDIPEAPPPPPPKMKKRIVQTVYGGPMLVYEPVTQEHQVMAPTAATAVIKDGSSGTIITGSIRYQRILRSHTCAAAPQEI